MNTRAWQVVFLLVLFALFLCFAYILRAVFIPLLVALLLAYILNPLVTKLEAKNVPRTASIGAIFGVFLLAFALVVLLVIPAAVRQGVEFVAVTFVGDGENPAKIDAVLSASGTKLKELTGQEWNELLERLRGELPRHSNGIAAVAAEVAATLGGWVASGVGAVFAALSFLVLIPVYLYFFLRGMNSGWERFKEWLPPRYRGRILSTLGKIHRANAAFFRGQVTICLIDGAILFAALLLLGVRFSFLFGLLYAVLSIVPYIGTTSAFAVTEIFVLADTGEFGATFFVVAGVFAAIQVLEGTVLQPLILGKETGLHPVLIIVSIFVFGQLLGFLGMLLAVPLFSAALIVVQDYVLPVFREVTAE